MSAFCYDPSSQSQPTVLTLLMMDGEDDAPPTPRKALWRSASWSGRPSPPPPPGPAPRRPPRSGRPSLPPLQLVSASRHNLNEWPRPGSDDSGELPHHHQPSPHPPTPSSSSVSYTTNQSSRVEFADRECSRVVDHVYLGSDAVARDREGLRRHGITHVLNCVGSACPEYFRGELVYKTLWLRDSPAEDITSVLYDAFDYLEEARAARGRALVHCHRGASRSAALVVAYLMWRHLLPFDDALRRVRAVRAVADPNLGFAAQLLRCQRRILLALPPTSPGSPAALPRAYRMAPQSPYDPLHLVPKAVDHRPSPVLDSRGAFIVHAPSSVVFVWLGLDCEPAMADSAAAAARQVVKYERARGPIITIHEGAETADFWAALTDPAVAAADSRDHPLMGEAGKRRVELFDLDFEIFRRALRGGVVPLLSMPGASSETHLPTRESGWCRLRQKLSHGGVKDSPTSGADDEDVGPDTFNSPRSFSAESSTTPSSLVDSASTLSTFSPASYTSSSDWNKYSPPGSNLHTPTRPPPSPPPHFSGLPPLNTRKGEEEKEKEKEKDSSFAASAARSLAERRGSIAPLLLLPPTDDWKRRLSPRDIVRDWFLSPFISAVEEDQGAMDTE